MDVYWFEQALGDVSEKDDWLGAWEQSHLRGLRFPKRRADWRLGRWTAKHAVARYLGMPCDLAGLASIQVRPSPSGVPELLIGDASGKLHISLTHSAGLAACAISPPGSRLGCDLELVEPRSDGFVADYFTAAEKSIVHRVPESARFAVITLLWSAKESALKALGEGLRMDTRCVSVTVDNVESLALSQDRSSAGMNLRRVSFSDLWRPLRVDTTTGAVFHGWWFYGAPMLRTLVSIPSATAPSGELARGSHAIAATQNWRRQSQ